MKHPECLECKKEFVQNLNGDRKFCSRLCRERFWRKNNEEKVREYEKKMAKLYRKKYPDRYRNYARTRRIAFQKEFNQYKISHGCSKCGYNKCPAALDFHHLYGKDFLISVNQFHFMSKNLQDELKKCVILCSNCHREEHWKNHHKEEDDNQVEKNEV